MISLHGYRSNTNVITSHFFIVFFFQKIYQKKVVERTAKLVSKWQSVGFCHGVLNTVRKESERKGEIFF